MLFLITLVLNPEDRETLGLGHPSSFSGHPQGTTFMRTDSGWIPIPFPCCHPSQVRKCTYYDLALEFALPLCVRRLPNVKDLLLLHFTLAKLPIPRLAMTQGEVGNRCPKTCSCWEVGEAPWGWGLFFS